VNLERGEKKKIIPYGERVMQELEKEKEVRRGLITNAVR
jgi:hypothetical protein